ncbi:MAG: hypothetical protein OJF62_002273 [Pseudolabrys sp.]|nr:hypothetical protein [Pseudolabrys sp.]
MNRTEHAVDVGEDIVIPESKHFVAFSFKPRCSCFIRSYVWFFAMLRAVDFDNQPRCHAHEVRNIGPNHYLPTEVVANDRVFAQ